MVFHVEFASISPLEWVGQIQAIFVLTKTLSLYAKIKPHEGKEAKMKSLWSKREAEEFINAYADKGVMADLALRVYSSRLLGSNPKLVLHGGGNVSVKTKMPDVYGNLEDVICVKGSGWDMADIEPDGLPAVRLKPIRAIANLEKLDDEDMVNVQRRNLLDSKAPNPSVETLLHAFLPHKYVDHTHANSVLALTDQPNGYAICSEVFGEKAALVPYIMPGFLLSKKALEVYQLNKDCGGLILMKHGIFTFGETAEESYERMIELITLAESKEKDRPARSFQSVEIPKSLLPASWVAPLLRGKCTPSNFSQTGGERLICTFRTNESILQYVNGKGLERYSQSGPVTPDHVIRTKPKPLIMPAPEVESLNQWCSLLDDSLKKYKAAYSDYFRRHNVDLKNPKLALDPMPRVVLVRGLGLFALGNSSQAAQITADIAESTINVISASERIGEYTSLDEAEIFQMEYWSLEQAKLGKQSPLPMSGNVVVITGGAGSIGAATAKAFMDNNAEVVLLDIDPERLSLLCDKIGVTGLTCNVTDRSQVEEVFTTICSKFGGIDVLVSNAGSASQGKIGEVSDEVLRKSFEINFFSHQTVAQAAVAIMSRQGTGGALLFNASKQAVNPGENFGPYGLPKAATLFLSRQYAVDYGSEQIRSNAINADRVRSGLMTEAMIAERAVARGTTPEDYMSGNLLGEEVTASDVANAFVNLALSMKTTGAVLTVDGGNIAAALR